MSVKTEDLVAELVATAPPGELPEVAEALSVILDGQQQSMINDKIEALVGDEFGVYSDTHVVSSLNRDPSTSKYIDHVERKLFNIDLASRTVIDVEPWTATVEYPPFYDELVTKLTQYGQDHFPSSYAFTAIPSANGLELVIIGERLNPQNFYTGHWKAHYQLNGQLLKGQISLDIHYFEDGNVRLKFDEPVSEALSATTASAIVNAINAAESAATVKILHTFEDLNQKSFKNLRRLLPVTRSKINWGKAIGNYRLGSDVVNQK
ncbi:F-actin-capping protein subunit alpha [[Candida] zeylanoides]